MWTSNGIPFNGVLVVNGARTWNPSPEKLIAAGYVDEVPHIPEPEPVVEPEIDTADFENACTLFRNVCSQIGSAIEDAEFHGGFDEMIAFQQSPVYNTLRGVQLALAWSAANELCKYEGAKIGLGQPDWWYRCWESNSETEAVVEESAE